MQRFESSKAGSSKFWQVELRGSSLALAWGKIGTQGQAKTKTFDDVAAARAERDKLVREKRRGGYVEVGAVKETPAPSAKSTKKAPAAAPTSAAKSTKKAPAAAGLLVMTDEQRGARDAWRQLPPPDARSTEELLGIAKSWIASKKYEVAWTGGRDRSEHARAVTDYALSSYAKGKPPTQLNAALEGGFAVLMESVYLPRLWVGLGGFPFALDAFAATWKNEEQHQYFSDRVYPRWAAEGPGFWDAYASWGSELWRHLAALLEAADATTQRAARQHAEKLRKKAALSARVALSLVFNEPTWAAEDAAELIALVDEESEDVYDAGEIIYLLSDRALLEACPRPEVLGHPLSLLARAGLEAVGVLVSLLKSKYAKKEAVLALACVVTPEAAQALASVLDKKDSSPAVQAYFIQHPELGLKVLPSLAAKNPKLAPYAEHLLRRLKQR